MRFGSAKRSPKTQLILSPAGSQTVTLPCPFPVRFRNAADRRRVPVSVLDYRPYRDSSAQRLDRLKRSKTMPRAKKIEGNLDAIAARRAELRSEEHTSELQSLMRNSYAVLCLKTKNTKNTNTKQKTR